jgi:hypothetical protein
MDDDRAQKRRRDAATRALYGVHYFPAGANVVFEAPESHLYYFRAFIGRHTIAVERGDCVYALSQDLESAILKRGPCEIESHHLATVVRGFTPSDRTCSLQGTTMLPYVNGCSTKQIFAPPRAGDPTLQYLKIPAYSAEQAHHIHSTVRVVYVLSGRGSSVVGMEGCVVTEELVPGKVCILEPMCPHHFETPHGEPLEVVPLHVFSSSRALEAEHPMYNGTYLTDQGR